MRITTHKATGGNGPSERVEIEVQRIEPETAGEDPVVELLLSEGDDDFVFANLTPREAREVAASLLHHASEIEAGR